MRFAATVVAFYFASGVEGNVWTHVDEELEVKNNWKLSNAHDPRREHRARLLEETHRHLHEIGLHAHHDYEQRQKLVDLTSTENFHTGKYRRVKSQIAEDEIKDEDLSFWGRFLDEAGSLPPTRAPVNVPTNIFPTRAPVKVPVASPTKAPVADLTNGPTTESPITPIATDTPLPPPTRAPVRIPTTPPPTTDAPIASPITPPPTAAPLTSPTRAPVIIPTTQPPTTDAPVPAPTDSPVPAPTDSPVPAPTDSPVPAPTDSPVPAPTDSPVPAPTDSPVPAPTDSPVPAPTGSPVPAPTDSPVPAPTNAPVTNAPVTNAPVTNAPVTNAPVTNAPVTNAPVTNAPVNAPVTNAPVPAPTVSNVRVVIESMALFDGDEFEDPNTYQSQALLWLETSDTQGLSDPRIIQRYALGCIYFATNEVRTVFSDIDLDGKILPWIRRNGWITDSNECDWANTVCDENGFIQILDLFGNIVTGEFPPEVVLLSAALQILDLGMNPVFTRGEIFNTYLGQLTELIDLRYEKTHFINDGGIPLEIGNLKKLEIYNCANVRYIGALNGNAFPSDMTALTHLEIEFNSYNSTVPSAIGLLPALRFFYVRNSFIEGDLNFMQPMEKIEECWVDTNPVLGGQSLPTFLGSIPLLASFSVTGCGWTGQMPSELGQLVGMQQMFFYDNNFAGTIPTEWGAFTRLRRLEVQLNTINGFIPQEVCDQTFGLLTTLKGDCNNCPMDNGDCCTSCFDDSGAEIKLVD